MIYKIRQFLSLNYLLLKHRGNLEISEHYGISHDCGNDIKTEHIVKYKRIVFPDKTYIDLNKTLCGINQGLAWRKYYVRLVNKKDICPKCLTKSKKRNINNILNCDPILKEVNMTTIYVKGE